MATRTSTSCTLSAYSFFIGLALVFCAIIPSNESKCFQDDNIDDDAANQLKSNGSLFWHNPCGKPTTTDSSGQTKGVNINLKKIDRIIVLTNYAMHSVQIFIDDFVSQTFRTSFKNLSDELKNITFEWLQQDKYMPKTLNYSQLDNNKITNVTYDVYMGLQYIAVGLDQVAYDQEKFSSSEFEKELSNSMQRLRAILCEMSNIFGDIHSVTRDVMPKSYCAISQLSCRLLRDWVILHEYFNGLKYMMGVFKSFKKNLH